MRTQESIGHLADTIEQNVEMRFFQRFRQHSQHSASGSRYWRLLAQRGWRPQRDEAISILANVRLSEEKRVAAQALYILTGDGRLLEGSHKDLKGYSLGGASSLQATMQNSLPMGSRAEATMVFMNHHLSAFQAFTNHYLRIGPGRSFNDITWLEISRYGQRLKASDYLDYAAIADFLELIKSDKKLKFYTSNQIKGEVLFRPKQQIFYIAEDLLTVDGNRDLFHKLLYQWLIFQDDFWFCHFLSAQDLVRMLRQAADETLTLCLSPDWFPRCYRELQDFQNPTQFEFLQKHKNPFLLTLEDLRGFKQHWAEQVLDRHAKLTRDILGMARAVLGVELKDLCQVANADRVPVPIPLRHLLNVAARLHFSAEAPVE